MLGVGVAGTESGAAVGGFVGLRNAFQIKRKGKNVDLLDLTVYGSVRAASGDAFEQPVIEREFEKRGGKFIETDHLDYYQPRHAIGLDWNASPFEWMFIEGDAIWDLDKYNRLTRAVFDSNYDLTWAVQEFFAKPFVPRVLRGRKDEVILDVGYRYLYEQANLITAGTRIWFDDFTPLLSLELQQKNWALELSRGWGFGFDVRFEAMSGTMQETEFVIYKTWKKTMETSVGYKIRDGEQSIMATFWLTAYPGTKIGASN